MKRKYTIEEIKKAITDAQLKVIDNFDENLEKAEKESSKLSSRTKMAMQMQNMMIIAILENEFIKELEGK